MTEINQLNIPAYQRKRSLAAKARKANIKQITKKTRKPTRTRPRTIEPTIEMSISEIIHEQETPLNPMDIFKPTKTSSKRVREMKICGQCEGYFDNIDVAIVKVTSALRTGDIIIFEKEGGLFEQEISSMQIDRKDVSLARAGSDIGLKVPMKPNVGTHVYKVLDS